MADSKCTHASSCALYSKFSLQGSLRIWQSRFCDHAERHKTCRRYVLSLAGERISDTLLPNGEELKVL